MGIISNIFNFKEKQTLEGIYTLYPLLPDGSPDYNHPIKSSKNAVQFPMLTALWWMLTALNEASSPYHNFWIVWLRYWTGTYLELWDNPTPATKFDSDYNTTWNTIVVLNRTAWPFYLGWTSSTYSHVWNLHTCKLIWTLSGISWNFKEIWCATFFYTNIPWIPTKPWNFWWVSRAAFNFSLDWSPVAIVYELNWNNAITNDSALLSATAQSPTYSWIANQTIWAVFDPLQSIVYSYSQIKWVINSNNTIDPWYLWNITWINSDKIFTWASWYWSDYIAPTLVPYKWNWTWTNWLTGATKIHYIHRYPFTFKNIPVWTYTSFYIQSPQQSLALYQKLINLTITNPVNLTTIMIDWIIE